MLRIILAHSVKKEIKKPFIKELVILLSRKHYHQQTKKQHLPHLPPKSYGVDMQIRKRSNLYFIFFRVAVILKKKICITYFAVHEKVFLVQKTLNFIQKHDF